MTKRAYSWCNCDNRNVKYLTWMLTCENDYGNFWRRIHRENEWMEILSHKIKKATRDTILYNKKPSGAINQSFMWVMFFVNICSEKKTNDIGQEKCEIGGEIRKTWRYSYRKRNDRVVRKSNESLFWKYHCPIFFL